MGVMSQRLGSLTKGTSGDFSAGVVGRWRFVNLAAVWVQMIEAKSAN